eukprot:scaffold3990_cov54-Attheya_sp.AAC.8
MVTFPFARNARRFVLTCLEGNAHIGRHSEGIDERGVLKQNSTSLTRCRNRWVPFNGWMNVELLQVSFRREACQMGGQG